jgi:photosystem II stability/assembly factor-like uncharacterized protein
MFKKIFFLIVFSSILSYAGWEKLTSNSTEWLTDVFFLDDLYGFTVGTNGAILKTTDGGDNWVNISIESSEWLTGVFFLNKDKGFIVGTNGILISTVNGGTNWNSQYLPYYANFHGVIFTDTLNGWITGGTTSGNSVILKTTDGGNSWLPEINGFNMELLGLGFKSNDTGYFVGRGGVLLKTEDSGYSWVLNSISYNVLECITFAGNDMWVTGDHNTLLKSTNDGQTWHIFIPVSPDHLFKAKFIDNNYGIIVGGYGSGFCSESSIIMETQDGGTTWKLTQNPEWSKLYSISVPSKSRAYAVGYDGTIVRYNPEIKDNNIVTQVINEKIPADYELSQNYPNPFNPSTTIQYSISKSGNVKINIYDIMGRLVKELINDQRNTGKYSIVWNGKDNFGNSVSSGAYFYHIQAGDFVRSKKMILLK